jgi:hypothetical protein
MNYQYKVLVDNDRSMDEVKASRAWCEIEVGARSYGWDIDYAPKILEIHYCFEREEHAILFALKFG